MIPIGTLSQKAARQLQVSTSHPPSDGPSDAATPPMADHPAAAAPRCDSGNSLNTIVAVMGKMSAANTAWIARAAINHPGFGARAANTDATVKPRMPTRIVRLRPQRSPTTPPTMNSGAPTMVNTLRTHDSVELDELGNSSTRSG